MSELSSSNQPETKVLLHTSMGDITIALRNDMPITTSNFKNLVQHGTFNGTIFHRVIKGFMIQGGDPTGTGYGDPSIPDIKDEFTRKTATTEAPSLWQMRVQTQEAANSSSI